MRKGALKDKKQERLKYPEQLERKKNKLSHKHIQKSEAGLHQHFEYANMICSKKQLPVLQHGPLSFIPTEIILPHKEN